ncbi:MAG TPA: hypothetical protein VHL54_02275 [Actinomycetota bacterium]|nr:hypothetical protein [Actinomycetota bacterium]
MVGKPYEGQWSRADQDDESSKKLTQQYLAAGIAAGIVVVWALVIWFGLGLLDSVT